MGDNLSEAFEPYSFKKAWLRAKGIREGGETSDQPFRPFSFSNIINKREPTPSPEQTTEIKEDEEFIQSITDSAMERLREEKLVKEIDNKPSFEMTEAEKKIWAQKHGFSN